MQKFNHQFHAMFSRESKLTIVVDSYYIPKGNRRKPRGEDAHFLCRKAQVIGVADGVGGWAKRGIDAGEYARQLMTNAAASVENSSPADVDPKSVLVHAHRKTAAPGSSTACIISVAGNRLRAANVGDSGFAVIRGGKTVYRSPVQQHSFNTPYQIGMAERDRPEAAAEVAVGLESGDVIVAATDGLFDNVFPEDVEKTVALCMVKHGVVPAAAARELAVAARRKSLERDTVSPFEAAARERDAGFKGRGGKRDDITVVVAYVIRDGILDSLSNFALSWVRKKIFSWIYLEPLYYYSYVKSFYELKLI